MLCKKPWKSLCNRYIIPFPSISIQEKMDASQLHSTMGDPNQGSARSSSRRRRNREIETLSLEIRNYPRDLVHTFLSTDPNRQQSIESEIEEQGEEIEFNLGLSLGGRFGVDKPHRGLIRSSSIAGSLPCLREEVALPLPRTSSLPSLTEEEWRRRKATLRRMEAKRRRSEKQRSLKEAAGEERESGLRMNPGPGPGLPDPAGKGGIQGKGGFFRSLQGLLAHQEQQLKQGCSQSQGSGESQGGSSSCASGLDSKTHQGSGSLGEAALTGSASGTKYGEGSSKQPETQDHRKKEAGASKGEEMPSVFTIGDGPNGRKVEGILYRYSKGEEVRIMCICHGSFFSPAEFVKHAGCSDVEHPLRHIVVNPSSSPF